jgi:hypothetical protein
MSWKSCALAACVLVGLTACKESSSSEADHEGKAADSPAARAVRDFYAAADKPAGEEACTLLTERGIRAIVHVSSRAACAQTIDGFAPGSFSDDSGLLLRVEGVEQSQDGFDVDGLLKGRSGGTYSVVERHGRFLIDGFKPEKG